MTQVERDLIMGLTTGSMTKDEFLQSFPVDLQDRPDYPLHALEQAARTRNADDVEYALLLGYALGFSAGYAPALRLLLKEDWHHKHEDMVSILSHLADPESVTVLYETALAEFDYLAYDESRALAVKCIWALGKLGGPDAVKKLLLLARSGNAIIHREAAKQLQRLNGRP